MSARVVAGLMIALLVMLTFDGKAIESGPSNTVGFWKLEVQPGFTQISFPLLPADKSLDNVLADQLTGGAALEESDQIMRWDATLGNYQIAWYDITSSHWTGDFDQVSEIESYWIYVQPGHPATQTIVTYGNVIEEPFYNMGTMTSGYNAIGSVWAIPAAISQAGLDEFQGGVYLFLSDLIMSYDAGTGSYTYAWKDGADQWQGNLTEFVPLKGYWIYVAPGHTGFEWPSYPQPNPEGLDSQTQPGAYPGSDFIQGRHVPPLPPANTPAKIPVSSTSGKGGVR